MITIIKRRFANHGFFLFIPIMIVFFIFNILPLVISLALSFFKWSGGKDFEFLGFENYIFLLTEDTYFVKAANASLMIFLFGVLPQHLIAIPLALVLNGNIKGQKIFRMVFFMPYVMSAITAALIFSEMFAYQSGAINYLLSLFNLPIIPKFTQYPAPFLLTMSLTIIWRNVGWNLLLYLAALSSIPLDLYEAADLDGASTFFKHFYITLPYMLPAIFFTVTLSIVSGMQIFDEPYILSGGIMLSIQGGPDWLGRPLTAYIIWLMQKLRRFDRGCAVALVLFFIMLIFTAINRKLSNYIGKK
ncbi:MAG: sugar ABC transporter permease [Spirochaetales bacterium]|nr:sugar ABC transporter permease [Spirochaetales bacterium]